LAFGLNWVRKFLPLSPSASKINFSVVTPWLDSQLL